MQPRRMQGKQAQVSKAATLPAPTSGWYVGDNQATAPPKTAIVMNNVFPEYNYVRVRGGSTSWATGIGAHPIQSLMPWTNGITSKLFAGANGKIYDVTTQGAVGAAAVSGLTNNFHEYAQFSGFGGTYLVCVNGIDAVNIFDGTGWNRTFSYTGTLVNTVNSITGMSSVANLQIGMALSAVGIPSGTTITNIVGTTLTLSAACTAGGSETITFYQNAPITGYPGTGFSQVFAYKGRLYFIDAQTFNVYYLNLAAIGGPATLFPLGAYFSKGGYLLTASSWTVENNYGVYPFVSFISSEGEVVTFNGSYPGDTAWTLTGSYSMSKPVGRRCLMPAGGDLLIMTEDGIVAMSQVQTVDQVALLNQAVTMPIAPAWQAAVASRGFGSAWQIVQWKVRTMAMVALPKLTASDTTQFVANSRTGAWTQYLGWDANCFGVINDQLYYGDSNGTVWAAESGGLDAGTNSYVATVMMSFTDFGEAATSKQIKLVKPYVQSPTLVISQITINVDYNIAIPSAPNPSSGIVGALWDVSLWDNAVWGGGLINQSVWQNAQGDGTAIAVVWQTTAQSSTTPNIQLAAFDVLYEPGSVYG